jgi:Fe-S cluster assembly protein SufD
MIALEPFVAEAEQAVEGRRDAGWVTSVRRDALDRFQALGFPTTRDEEWRFTSVSPIAEGRFALAPNGGASIDSADLAPFDWDGDRSATIVFVNGRYAPAASRVDALPAGVRVDSLAPALAGGVDGVEAHLTRIAPADRRAFTALNTAFLSDGAFIHVPAGTTVPRPIHLLFLSTGASEPAMTHPRVLVVLGATSQASIVESYGAVQAQRYFTNAVTEIAAGEGATLEHYRIQREPAESYHLGALYVRASRDANVTCHSVSLGGAIVRNDVVAILEGEGATCTLTGLYLGDGSRLVDNHTTIDHASPHCGSREIYKGILADRSRAVFNGKIIVRPDAQQTDAKQTNKALLLSDDAQINTKPQLEIFANDVKCTHGAAVGQMDEDAIFYLRARGVGLAEARRILIHAFAGDVLNQMALAALRLRIDAELGRRLAGWRV